MSVHHFVSPQAPLKTRATHLPGQTLIDYLQLCHYHFEGEPPLHPILSPFLLLFTHKGGQTGHKSPLLQGVTVYATANAKSPSARPTERRCESFGPFGGMEIGTMRLSDASRGGPRSLNRIQDIVEPCGQGHSGRHPTHKRVFHANRLTETGKIFGKRRISQGKLHPCQC